MTKCPCISGLDYHACCEPLHKNVQVANSAEQLMCSRYSAYYLGLHDYLINTTYPSSRQADDSESLQLTFEETQWLGLKLIKHKPLSDKAQVEFVAFFQDEPIGQLHELSNFIQDKGRWFYVDGRFLPPIKLARNELCFCGSGKKLKKCHMK